jgi:hypothetical protein
MTKQERRCWCWNKKKILNLPIPLRGSARLFISAEQRQKGILCIYIYTRREDVFGSFRHGVLLAIGGKKRIIIIIKS